MRKTKNWAESRDRSAHGRAKQAKFRRGEILLIVNSRLIGITSFLLLPQSLTFARLRDVEALRTRGLKDHAWRRL